MDRKISVVMTRQELLGSIVTSPATRARTTHTHTYVTNSVRHTQATACTLSIAPVINPTSPNSSSRSRYFWLLNACTTTQRAASTHVTRCGAGLG